ncbi:MAG: 50S ribosomal protein L25 [Terrimicrobiaceae bacterium]|nr:50S ribosomal protein L25 [Terrimicrobiaceae bacterium]
MANQVKLSARPRLEAGRNAVKQVRARGAVPAVIYGAHETPANLEVDRKAIETLLAHAASEHVLVDLEIAHAGRTTNKLSLIQEIQHHPVRGEILHIDFHAVSTTETITSEVPIESVGEPIGVKTHGGLLQQQLRSLDIECLPQNLPDLVVVDVSGLNIGDSIHVKNLTLPAGVTALADADITVFLVSEPTVAEEPVVAEAPAAPEVIKEKKPEAEAEKK